MWRQHYWQALWANTAKNCLLAFGSVARLGPTSRYHIISYYIISYHIILYYIISYIISLGTREEVPPPCNFLMARGGGGEVKTRQAEPGGDGGVRGNWDFSSKMPTFLHLHNQLVSCGLAVVFTSMYQFSAGKKVRVKRCEVWGGSWNFWWDVASVESLSPFETFVVCVLSYFRQCLTRNRWVWKCSPK